MVARCDKEERNGFGWTLSVEVCLCSVGLDVSFRSLSVLSSTFRRRVFRGTIPLWKGLVSRGVKLHSQSNTRIESTVLPSEKEEVFSMSTCLVKNTGRSCQRPQLVWLAAVAN